MSERRKRGLPLRRGAWAMALVVGAGVYTASRCRVIFDLPFIRNLSHLEASR